MKNKQQYLIASAVILILAVSVYFWQQERFETALGKKSNLFGDLKSNLEESTVLTDEIKATGPTIENGIYKNKKLGFSVAIPAEFKITETNPDEFSTLVLAETANLAEKRSFQIFIMPFDEIGPITKERILIDLPNAVINEPQEILINGVPAFLFFGHDEFLGPTREVWMVEPQTKPGTEGHLFQISSYASFDEELSKIMATFQFHE